MDNELLNYKKKMIEQIRQQFNYSQFSLKKQLLDNINKINSLNINRTIKIMLINNFIKIYNNSVSKIISDYTKNINNINSLSQIPTNKYGLLIGINDANNIRDTLLQHFSYNNFTVLTDLTETKPTKQNIINSLTNLLVNSRKGDSLFFLYSGHGTCTIDLNNDETDGQDEMIVPLDATGISTCILDDEFNDIIRTNLKEGVKLFMLFDCCFSGTMADLKYNYFTRLHDSDNITINPNALETIGQVIMISGCRDSQTSADTIVNYGGQNIYSGAMTFSFLKTIQELGTKISLKTLFENMRKILRENQYSQIPQLSSGTLIDINNTCIDF
jgi:hypothetical protein